MIEAFLSLINVLIIDKYVLDEAIGLLVYLYDI